MFCKFCKTKLNPYMIKQLDENFVIEIECMECRKYNYIDKETYFYVRKDWEMPTIQPINNKLPKDMNIIVVSTERCGISWVCKIISEIHEKMFGTCPEWNYEISRVDARKKHLPLPQGWNTVYNIDPQKLVDRDYDRVLIIQRDLKELLKAQIIYWHNELSYIGLDNESLLEKTKRYWNLVYGKKISSPKCLRIRLEDLNNYTVSTFNEILDFLNFPSFSRPVLIPISPPNRNWEAYSSVLPKGHNLFKRLEEIDEAYKL